MNLSFLKNTKIDQVVWLGAGDVTKAELAFSPKTTVHLVDADEAIVERLTKRFKQDKNVTVHPLVISDKNNNADFTYYSLKEFNGIAQPEALKQRYPGLKQVKSDNKKATAISTFFADIELSEQKNNTIIFDLPGLSSRLLQSLINDETLHMFNELVALTSQQPLFKGDLPASDLIELLEKNGFLCQTHQSTYQDYVTVQAQLNPLYKELIETKKRLKQLPQEFHMRIEDEKAKNKALTQTNIALSEELAQVNEHSKNLLTEKERVSKELDSLRNQVEKELASSAQNLTNKINELQANYNALQKQYKQLEIVSNQHKTQNELLKDELIKAESQIALIKDIFLQTNSFQQPKG